MSEFARPAIERQFGRFYTPSNMVISVAGHLQHARVLDLIEKRFGRMKKRPLRRGDVAPPVTAHIALRDKQSLEQAHFCMGVPAYPLGHERRYGAFLLNSLLGGGMSSRLFQRVREELGLAYSVYTFQSFHVDSGTHGVYLGTSPVNAELAIEAVRGELARLVRDGIPDPEIAMGKQQVKGQITLAMEGVTSRMYRAAAVELFGEPYAGLDDVLAKVDAITPEDVAACCAAFFAPDRQTLVSLGPT